MRISPYNIFHFSLWLLLLMSCVVDRNQKGEYLQKSLNNSIWELTRVNDHSRRDTISFSFGYSNTNDELNLLAIHSGPLRELSTFSLSKRKIRFVFGNGFYSLNNVKSKAKSQKYVFIFNKDSLRFKRPSGVNRKIKIRRI